MEKVFWNPWHGCHKISSGCQNCYVYYLDRIHDRDASVIKKSSSEFNKPMKRDRQGNYKIPSGTEVNTCFTSDFFIEEADEWRSEAWGMIKDRLDLRFLICTKRVQRIQQCLPPDWGSGYNNVFLAVSCENQQTADERLPIFERVSAKHKYIFAAPLLSEITFDPYVANHQIELISICGESYEHARACNYDWVKRIHSTCKKFGVGFIFHETGSNFVMNGKVFHVPRDQEYEQAHKGMACLEKG